MVVAAPAAAMTVGVLAGVVPWELAGGGTRGAQERVQGAGKVVGRGMRMVCERMVCEAEVQGPAHQTIVIIEGFRLHFILRLHLGWGPRAEGLPRHRAPRLASRARHPHRQRQTGKRLAKRCAWT